MNTWLRLLLCCFICYTGFGQTTSIKKAEIINLDEKGRQLVRFSDLGNALDAHDGEIAFFNGVYYLYGTSYDCGFEWGTKTAPFCGFKCYSSTDLVNWTDKGFLFDAQTPVWQKRCNGNTYGCFRPHVIFNKQTGLYVLWINVYDNVSGYRVFTSKTPTGSFTEVEEPHLAVNSTMPAGELNNGDHDTFVDDDGRAYLAYTDWRAKGAIVIEELSKDYLTGTGRYIANITPGQTEAPGLFKRNGIYYVVYSDPNCGYCSGTGASYRTAMSPLGPWSDPRKISDNSCGGQPSFVSTIKLPEGNIFLFGSDLWNNAAKNEALANFFWAPLSFNSDGSIKTIACNEAYQIPGTRPGSQTAKRGTIDCALSKGTQITQPFVAAKNGTLKSVSITTYQSGRPDADLELAIYNSDKDGKPNGERLAVASLSSKKIGWSAKKLSFDFSVPVKKDAHYCMVISSSLTQGCYGFAYASANDSKPEMKYEIKIVK